MNIHFSSNTNEWYTPQDFFDDINKEFGFTIDVCATDENTKVKGRYFTQKEYGGCIIKTRLHQRANIRYC